jgi:putative FmdB family regulatory protein
VPIYEYLCGNGHRFDVMQRMSDDPVQTCEVCAAPVQRVLHPVAVHFKGSGFYTTDYGRGKGAKAEAAKESSGSSTDGGSSSSNGASSEGSSSKPAETKKAAAAD